MLVISVGMVFQVVTVHDFHGVLTPARRSPRDRQTPAFTPILFNTLSYCTVYIVKICKPYTLGCTLDMCGYLIAIV